MRAWLSAVLTGVLLGASPAEQQSLAQSVATEAGSAAGSAANASDQRVESALPPGVAQPDDGAPADSPAIGPLNAAAGDVLARLKVGGQYRVMFNSSNFSFHPADLMHDQRDQTFFNQRFRTWLAVSPNEQVEGYLQVEMGHILWTENFDFPKTYAGPFSPAGDRVGIELRRGYLTYKPDELGTFRVGIQDWHDAFGESPTLGTIWAVDDYDSFGAVLANSIWDFNVGGLSYTNEFVCLRDMSMNAAAMVLWEGDTLQADDAFLFALDLDWPVLEKHGVGASIYYLPDHGHYSYPTASPYDSAWDVWIGARGTAALQPVPLRGFFIFNFGQRNELGGVPDFAHQGVALMLHAGPIALAAGKLSLQALYSTGNDDPGSPHSGEFRTIAQSARDNFGSQGYWSYLILSSPHGPSDVNDLGVSLQNRGLGLFTVQAKYEYPICTHLAGVVAAGWLQSDEENSTNGSSEMGTELAKMFTLQLAGGLAIDFGGAVLFTGDFYRLSSAAPSPDTLWEAFARVQLEF